MGVDPAKIAVCGFSAGGHLAASLGVHWNSEKLRALCPVEGRQNRPDAMILSYPVISAQKEVHPEWHDSFSALLGPERHRRRKKPIFHWKTRWTKNTVPAFCWHTMDDDCVCVTNTMRFVKSLYEHGVPADATFSSMGITACPCAPRRWEMTIPMWRIGLN